MALKNWSTDSSSNVSGLTGINWNEGMNAASVNDSARATMAQLAVWRDQIKGGTVYPASVGGTANAITLTCSPTIDAYGAGQNFIFKAASTNTGSVTVNVDGNGARTVQSFGANLKAGAVISGCMVHIVDDGTNFQLISVQSPGIAVSEQSFGITRGSTSSATTAFKSAMAALAAGDWFSEGAGTSLRSNLTTSITPPAWARLSGRGSTSSIDAYSSTSSFFFTFSQVNPGLTLDNFGVTLSGATASGMQALKWGADRLTINGVDCNGLMANSTGGSLTTGLSTFMKPVNASTVKGLRWSGGQVHHCYSAYGKSNSDTGVQKNIRVRDVEFHHNYGGDLQFNSPLGSQSDIIVEGCYFHDPIYISAYAGQEMAVAVAYGDNVRILYNRMDGDYYQAIHLEGTVSNFSIIGNRGSVASSGIICRPVGSSTYPQYGEIAGNNFTQSGTSRESPNYCIGVDSKSTGYPGGLHLQVHDNIAQGSGFAAGFYFTGLYTDGPSLYRVHHNTAVSTAIGMYFPDNSAWGGIDIQDNTTVGCPIHIKAAMAMIESHNFVNCDPAASTSVPFAGVNSTFNFIAIKHARFSFAPVTIASAGTKDFALVRLAANDRLAATITAHAQMNNGSRMATALYNGVAWDGTNAPTFTNLGGESAHNMTVVCSKKTISSVDYLVATVTNSSGASRSIALTANIDGIYTYYGT